jgi:hypothetical protein
LASITTSFKHYHLPQWRPTSVAWRRYDSLNNTISLHNITTFLGQLVVLMFSSYAWTFPPHELRSCFPWGVYPHFPIEFYIHLCATWSHFLDQVAHGRKLTSRRGIGAMPRAWLICFRGTISKEVAMLYVLKGCTMYENC